MFSLPQIVWQCILLYIAARRSLLISALAPRRAWRSRRSYDTNNLTWRAILPLRRRNAAVTQPRPPIAPVVHFAQGEAQQMRHVFRDPHEGQLLHCHLPIADACNTAAIQFLIMIWWPCTISPAHSPPWANNHRVANSHWPRTAEEPCNQSKTGILSSVARILKVGGTPNTILLARLSLCRRY